MIKFQIKGKSYSFSGFNVSVSQEDEIISITGEKADVQFTLEFPENGKKTLTKEESGTSMYFSSDDGTEYSAYFEDDEEGTYFDIKVSQKDGKITGSFDGKLKGERKTEKIKNGSFSVNL